MQQTNLFLHTVPARVIVSTIMTDNTYLEHTFLSIKKIFITMNISQFCIIGSIFKTTKFYPTIEFFQLFDNDNAPLILVSQCLLTVCCNVSSQ